MKCKLLGCAYEVGGESDFQVKALDNHLSAAHGIGSVKKESHFGCPFRGCHFSTSGSREFTTENMGLHLRLVHDVDPEKPETLPVAGRTR